jgi:integrase/recombinase XerD
MLKKHFHREHVRARIHANPLAGQIENFVAYLDRRGHSNFTIQSYTQVAEHFGRCVQFADGTRVSRKGIDDFIRLHLPYCSCDKPAPCHVSTVRAALRHLLRAADQSGAEEIDSIDQLTQALNEFARYLRCNAGLAESTCRYRIRYAREFLTGFRDDGEVDFGSLTPKNVMNFVVSIASRCSRSSAQVAAVSIRSFLRFLQFEGFCNAALVQSVPRIPQSRLSGVPSVMQDDQVLRFLNCFNRFTATGRRDYAMALCMVELGLRVSEVAGMETTHIDWRHAVLTVPAPKSRQARQLPLSSRHGEALTEYLRNGRPQSQSKFVFLRHRVPLGKPVTKELVRGVMRRCYARCGFCDWTGTHVLRHTAATRVHQRGATLKEVADLLGHRSIDTAMIYTKVNLPELRSVALPWPEVQS